MHERFLRIEQPRRGTLSPAFYGKFNHSSARQDFAQISATFIYTLLHSSTLPPGMELACMQNQINFMRSLPQFNPLTLFGNRCDIADSVAASGARHNATPPVLDPTRTFATVPLDLSPTAAGHAVTAALGPFPLLLLNLAILWNVMAL
ncbi:hypothetical protein MKEN_00284500 [Mycena kentingensis (nom. inval.)]|nr:hypothetical protein MKEN_00284500 [Mycena kentingensis (nom. inval.)]